MEIPLPERDKHTDFLIEVETVERETGRSAAAGQLILNEHFPAISDLHPCPLPEDFRVDAEGRVTCGALRSADEALTPEAGSYTFEAIGQPFLLGIKPCSDRALLTVKHTGDLRRAGITVALSMFQAGIGTGSCGPIAGEEYQVPGDKDYEYAFFDEIGVGPRLLSGIELLFSLIGGTMTELGE